MGFGTFLFQAEDGIRYLVRSRGLGDVYKRQVIDPSQNIDRVTDVRFTNGTVAAIGDALAGGADTCLLYTSDAADERSSVDLGGRRIIQRKNT